MRVKNCENCKHCLKKRKEIFCTIACGRTDLSKGVAHQDNIHHISYYLYNYLDDNLNPYTDFVLEESLLNE